MIRIYSDAAFDEKSGVGVYCVVIAKGDHEQPKWYTGVTTGGRTSYDPEVAGVRQAIKEAEAISDGRLIRIYCDNMAALKTGREECRVNTEFVHIKAHTIGNMDVPVTRDTKRQHWADVIAGAELRALLDILTASE